MKELNMKPEEIANLVVLSREKGYAIVIPQDSLYLVSKAFQKQLAHRDAQIAALTADNRNYSELLQYHIDRQAKAEAQLAELDKQMPVGTVTANSDNDSIAIIDSVIPVGTELFLRPVPPAPVKLPSLKQAISGERYVWSDGVCNYQQDVIEILKAAGVIVEVADE
ncbi:hypothetical protein [Mixta calida]|uniref:hypothetical protein n=1 Tax=Mixta calida TaxID=665913 RepID=UPI0028985388|nr:hypothetical protein [Mixta calida]